MRDVLKIHVKSIEILWILLQIYRKRERERGREMGPKNLKEIYIFGTKCKNRIGREMKAWMDQIDRFRGERDSERERERH